MLIIVLLLGGTGIPECADLCEVQFFYSKSCPHCKKQMVLMEALAANNADLKIHFYEVSEHQTIWQDYLDRYNIQYRGFPRTFIGSKTFVGYSNDAVALEYSDILQGYLGNRVQIVKAIEKMLGHKVQLGSFNQHSSFPKPTILQFWPLLLPLIFGLSYFVLKPWLIHENRVRLWQGGFAATSILSFFLLLAQLSDATIRAYAEGLPYPVFVTVIALADGFNPCAFTVLIILLSLLTYTKSRRDMILLGGTFIATSAIMYFIFIMLLVIVGGFFLERYGRVIMLLLGAAITGAGLLNIKDFFFLNKGFSLSLSEQQKLKFTKQASGVVKDLGRKEGKLYLAVGGTITLGVFVNLVELGCTAILPVVYLTTLVGRYDSYFIYSAWTAFYCIIYVIPLLVILANFVYFFKSVRLSEKQGRLLKLISGAFMLLFGLLMMFKPEMLSFSWL